MTNWFTSLGAFGHVVAGVLIVDRLAEDDRDAQEAQLHALAELHEWGLVSAEQRELVSTVTLDEADPAQEEYLDYLLDRS